jgi:hypothetical protein
VDLEVVTVSGAWAAWRELEATAEAGALQVWAARPALAVKVAQAAWRALAVKVAQAAWRALAVKVAQAARLVLPVKVERAARPVLGVKVAQAAWPAPAVKVAQAAKAAQAGAVARLALAACRKIGARFTPVFSSARSRSPSATSSTSTLVFSIWTATRSMSS